MKMTMFGGRKPMKGSGPQAVVERAKPVAEIAVFGDAGGYSILRPKNGTMCGVIVKCGLIPVFVVCMPPVHAAQQDHRGDRDGKRGKEAVRAAEPAEHAPSR